MVLYHSQINHLMDKYLMLQLSIVHIGSQVTLTTIIVLPNLCTVFIESSFVDMYKNGEYIYAFFREVAVELDPDVS